MTQSDTVRIRTFWISIIAAVAFPAILNYGYMTAVVDQLEHGQRQNATAIALIQQQILDRTVSRFRREDWEKEEAKIEEEFRRLHTEINRTMDKIDDIWRYISSVENRNHDRTAP